MNFSVGIYNINVRQIVREEGETWDEEATGISADFESVLYFEYPNLASVEQAERVAEAQFPKSKGFRIDFIKSF